MGPVATQLNSTRYFPLKSYGREDGVEVTALVDPSCIYILPHTIWFQITTIGYFKDAT